MSSLSNQLLAIDRQLNLLSNSSENATAISEINALVGELEVPYKSLEDNWTKRQNLQTLPNEFLVGMGAEEPTDIDELVSLMELIESEWSENSYRLRQARLKTTLIEKMNALSDVFSTKNKRVWKGYVGAERARFSVTEAEMTSARLVNRNTEKVRKYERYLSQFNEKSNSLPSSPESIADLRNAANSLEQLKAEIEWQLPDEVKRFYQELDAGAPLSSLTKTVLEWLEEHNALKDLHIKRKGDNSWQDGQYRR